MRFPSRPARATLLALATLVAVGAAPSAGRAAQRLEAVPVPSTQGNVVPSKVQLNDVASLNANVLLPDGYDEDPGRRWPVLYLLHGGYDNYTTWANPENGDALRQAAGFPGIVVMPEGGRGDFVDEWRGGARDGANWTRYYLNEVVPFIESRYRILPGRRWHAIGGMSMGAYGAVFLGGQLPGYFGTVVSMSALLDNQAPSTVLATLYATDGDYDTRFGPVWGPYAAAHNPLRTIANVAGSRVYISSGNGLIDPAVPSTVEQATIGGVIEARVKASAIQYGLLAPFAGARPTIRIRLGLHSWPFWRADLARVLRWGPFGEPPVADAATNRRWEYVTMEPAGNAWGIGYRFLPVPDDLVTFKRDGQVLSASGAGTVRITPGARDDDASGGGTREDCAFTATLPFRRMLPAGC